MSNESFNQAPSHLQKSDTAVGFYLLAMVFFARVSALTWMILLPSNTVYVSEVLTVLAVLFLWRGTSHRLEKSCGFVLLVLQVISSGLYLTGWLSPEIAYWFKHVGLAFLGPVFQWTVVTGLCGLLVLRTLRQHGKQTAIWSGVAFCLSVAQLVLSAVGIFPTEWVTLFLQSRWEWLLHVGLLAFWIYQAYLCAKTTHHHTEPFEPSDFAMLTWLRVMYVLLFLLLVLFAGWVVSGVMSSGKIHTLFQYILTGLGLFVLWGIVALAWYSRKTIAMFWFATTGLVVGILFPILGGWRWPSSDSGALMHFLILGGGPIASALMMLFAIVIWVIVAILLFLTALKAIALIHQESELARKVGYFRWILLCCVVLVPPSWALWGSVLDFYSTIFHFVATVLLLWQIVLNLALAKNIQVVRRRLEGADPGAGKDDRQLADSAHDKIK